MRSHSKSASRRNFLKTGALGAASTLGFPGIVRGQNLNSKLQAGFIAVGGRAQSHCGDSHKRGVQAIAFADVDRRSWSNVLEKEGWGEAKGYTDWREVFSKHGEELDLVYVSTPDHNHFAPSMTAISMGIHCYTEKPLTWSVREAQLLTDAYHKADGVVTQMGNQGHGGEGWRVAYERIKGGQIGTVQEFHTWTNRPVWPQGGKRPEGSDPIPDWLDWESWIGAAPMRPYVGPEGGGEVDRKGSRGPYVPFNWRGVVDFGSGALGDMACHTTDGIYSIMDPGYAETAEPLFQTDAPGDQFQSGMKFKATYRAKGDQPAFATYWYEGKDKDGNPLMPDLPEELAVDGRQLPKTGNLVIGSEGKMIVEGDYWNSPYLIPQSRAEELGKPEKILERSPGHVDEFLMACRGEKPREFSQSNFGYAGPMTANIQLGNLAARVQKKLELDESGRITNDPSVNELAWREPRDGWGPMKSLVEVGPVRETAAAGA